MPKKQPLTMYEAFFGLREKPFQLTPDPGYLFLSDAHADVLTHLEYAVQENHGFVVITGEVGSGKTTLIQSLLRKVEQTVHVGVLANAALPPSQFLRAACEELEVPVDGLERVELLGALNRYLLERYAEGDRVALILDEAQALADDTLEEVRLVSNLQTEKHFLLQVILVGQPQLRDKIRQKSLEQLRQRVTVQCHLTGLKAEETGAYVRHRLRAAGAEDPEIFDPGALDALHRFAGGIPRLINVACDAALLSAFADGVRKVDAARVNAVVEAWRAGGTLEAPPPRAAEATPAPLDERLGLLELRLEATEDAVARLDQRLNQALGRVKLLVEHLQAAKLQLDRRLAEAAPPPPVPTAATSPRGLFARIRSPFRKSR